MPRMFTVLAAGVAFFTAGAVTTASADAIVRSSDAPGIKAGDRLPDDARVSLPAGSTLKLVREGSTQTVYGPYSGRLSDYSGKAPAGSGGGFRAGGTMKVEPPKE